MLKKACRNEISCVPGTVPLAARLSLDVLKDHEFSKPPYNKDWLYQDLYLLLRYFYHREGELSMIILLFNWTILLNIEASNKRSAE
jgi:hypothetical protein